MKKVTVILFFISMATWSVAQNVGIGVKNPAKKLSVDGSVVIDYSGKNTGAIDSAALIFGLDSATVGISSSRNGFHSDYLGLNLWTNKEKRLTILQDGNIGIGTIAPAYKLSVNGSIYAHGPIYANNSLRVTERIGVGADWDASYRLKISNGNAHFEDKVHIGGISFGSEQLYVKGSSIASYAARFTVGKVSIDDDLEVGHNLSVGTNISAGNSLTLGGNAFIGGAADYTYKMRVYGNARIDDNFRVNGKFATGGAVDDNYQLRVYGNGLIDDNFRVASKMAIGGLVDDNFKLRVYGGNSRFGGDVEVTGGLNVNNNLAVNSLTIGGKGSVKSNGSSSLKIHFTEVFVDHEFKGSGELSIYHVNLPDFDNASDVRLSISHFDTNIPVGFNPHNVVAFFTEVDPIENRAVLVLRSITPYDFIIGGTYYIMAVIKEN